MHTSNLALLNAVLFVVQAIVNVVYAKYFVILAREYETLIAPASFAFAIWFLIYALEAVLVSVDVFYPQYSLYADASQPGQLRACFGLTCVFNTLWLILYVKHHVHAATVMIILLWLSLLMLYIYSINDRNSLADMDWRLYVCNELPIALYFAWVTVLTFNHVAISLQHTRQAFLPVSVYVIHLTIVIVLALIAIIYGQDMAFGAVVIWYLSAVAAKHGQVPQQIEVADKCVRACAGEGAGIIGTILVISLLYMLMYDR
ncbi:TPA: hypothetical protein N0F65_006789 [Lagenidium giganteum]|uniref:Chitin synthase export chaperone n=1 Tax=Lagenidium giganteum TaxID=4803 RepID=A0AAV2ZCA5_9STRA|nr:TPA: hypothetical protein N0F65_006789 [Lagenidium giganteum]